MKGFVDPASVPTEKVQILRPDGTLVRSRRVHERVGSVARDTNSISKKKIFARCIA